MPNIDLSILNQRQTPAFYADILANRPAAGFIGRIFVSTNTYEFYRDNGTGWDLIGGPGAGTITGSGAAGQVTYWNGASTVTGDNGLFYDAVNDRLGIGTITPGAAIDAHSTQSTILQLNQTAINDTRIAFQLSGSALWRLGNFYNGGANDFELFDVIGAQSSVTVKKTTGQVLIGTTTVGSGKLVVASATGDNGIQIVGASAPSLRLDNAATGPTKRVGLGIATALNNFIQGAVDRDFCIFNGSTTAASPILFGVYDAGLTNVQEAARISAARNFIVGSTTDNGAKLQVTGNGFISGALGIGTSSLPGQHNIRVSRNISGSTIAYGILNEGITQSGVTNFSIMYTSTAQTVAAAFTLNNMVHYFAAQGTFGAGSTVTNQYGYWAENSLIGATNNYGFYGNIPSGNGRWNLYMNGTANNYMAGSLGIGSTSLTGYNLRVSKNITGSVNGIGIQSAGAIQSDVTSDAAYFSSGASTQATTFTITDLAHFLANQATFGAGSTVTKQYGFRVSGGLTGATNNYAFFSDIASGTNRWNLYMNGSASNYLNGTLLIGTTTDAGFKLEVNGTTRLINSVIIGSSATGQGNLYVVGGDVVIGNSSGLLRANNFNNGPGGGIVISASNTAANQYTAFGVTASGTGAFTEVARFSNNGNLLIGTATNGASKLRIVGLPTSAVGLSSGDIYSNAGILTIVP